MCFAITAGEYKGERVHKYQSVETEDDMVWLNRDLKRFGLEGPESGDDLVEIVKLLDDSKPELIIALVTKDSGQFTYINKVTTEIEAGSFAAEEGEEEPSEEPAEEEAAEEESSGEISEGDEVTFTSGSEELAGEVLEVVEDKARVKTEGGKVFRVALDKLVKIEEDPALEEEAAEEEEAVVEEEESAAEDEVEVKAGMAVQFKSGGKTLSGKISAILEDEQMVKVKVASGKVFKVPVDKLSLAEEKEEKKREPAKKKAAVSKVKKHKR
jgi:sRNA-binding protein